MAKKRTPVSTATIPGDVNDSAAQNDSATQRAEAAASNLVESHDSTKSQEPTGTTGNESARTDPAESEAAKTSTPPQFWAVDGVWYYERGGRSYELRPAESGGVARRVRIRLEHQSRRQFDSLDLVSSRARRSFAAEIHRVWAVEPAVIEADLADILDRIERAAEKPEAQERSAGRTVDDLTEAERTVGMELLRSPDVAARVVADIQALGYVGEANNSLLVYLAATSRKLASPLSVIIVSESASGKSYLVETVRKMMPIDDVVAATSLSDQALNYIEDLRHKFLILGEAVHSEAVEHQIREMLSSKELRRLVTVKEPESGRLVSHMISTPVVVASVMSSTRHRLNPENASRCFVIGTDESDEQTRRIHEAQRAKYTIEGVRARREVLPTIISRHQAAQLLLEPVAVVNPLAEHLDFPAHRMRLRRDHERFLDLIASVAFLRQFQKERQHDGSFEYIEVDLADYRIAYDIMVGGVLEQTLRELPRAALRLLEHIRNYVARRVNEEGVEPVEITFTQRTMREVTGASHTWVKEHLRQLVEYEYVDVVRGGGARTRGFYRLVATNGVRPVSITTIPTPQDMAEWTA